MCNRFEKGVIILHTKNLTLPIVLPIIYTFLALYHLQWVEIL